MNRRGFIATSVAMAAAAQIAEADFGAPQEMAREYYELRLLTFASQSSLDRYAGFLKEAYIPAFHRNRIGVVGAFIMADKPEADKPDSLSIYILKSFPSVGAYAEAENRMLADAEFSRAGAAVQDLPSQDPPYTQEAGYLLRAFEGWPKLKTPRESVGDKPRVFELRTYESHSRKANRKKIEMFNAGEAQIFARCGFQPVFFSEALVGPQLPNLTYMVTYPNIESRDSYWKAFGADPEKARLFAIPEYADRLIVSKIHSTLLKPLPGSMI